MRVLVTGGTGFIGSHSVAALVRAGHRVRLLARDPAGVDPVLAPLGVPPGTVAVAAGDATDPTAVAAAVHGCDAVLHAAGRYSFDTRDHRWLYPANVRATEVVLAAALAAGADPVVHVSTFGVLRGGSGRPLTADAPVGTPREAYLASKAAADTIARRYQAAGAPVVISYPLASLGPHDPRLGDQTTRVRNALRGLMPLWPTGGFPIGDVRDVAALHAALLRGGDRPGRVLAPGRYVSTRELLAALRRASGRRLPALRLPARAMLPVGALVGVLQRVLPVHLPAEYGAIYACLLGAPVDTSVAEALLGRPPRPLDETVADTVGWLRRGTPGPYRGTGGNATEEEARDPVADHHG